MCEYVCLEEGFQEENTVRTKTLSKDGMSVHMWSSLCLDFEGHK